MGEAVKLEESSYSKLLETMLEGMIVGQGNPPRIIFANRSLAEILGYSVDELTSLPSDRVVNLIFPDDQKMFFGNYRARLEGKPAPARYEFRGVKKNKEVIWLEISSSRVTFGGQPAIQAVFIDITERKKAEEMLNARLKEIEEFNKAAVGRELKIVELEKENNALLRELGRQPRYNEERNVEPPGQVSQRLEARWKEDGAALAECQRIEDEIKSPEVSFPEVTLQEKKEALRQGLWITYLTIPFLWLILLVLRLLGYEVRSGTEALLMGTALANALIAHFCLARGWLIEQLYAYLYSAILSVIIAAAIYQTGNVVSPFVWIGLFIMIYDVIVISSLKGIAEAIFFIVSLWLIALAEMTRLIPSLPMLPELRVIVHGRYILLMLVSNSLLFGVITAAVVFISDRMRQEKKKALLSARESAQAYSASVRIMKDLNDSHRQLQEEVEELERAREAALQLMRDIQQAKEEADQKTVEMAKLYEQLKSVDKMKTEFLSVISHELRTPLTPILGYTSMFLKEQFGGLAPEYKERADLIRKESEHLLGIIDSILDVSRLERGISLTLVKEPISIGVILAELVDVMSPQFVEREIKAGIDLPPGFPVVMGDAGKIRRLLTNILGNTVNFTPKGGSVIIRGEQKDDYIELSVKDSGIGVTRENLPRLFEKFFQVDGTYTRAVGGIGLGLAIAKEIVEAHGGRIWAESPGLGLGTTIRFTLPISR